MTWQRACTEDKKQLRKEAIFEAATELFKRDGYENVSFNSIAKEAGFTKSNMYRYFNSKEEIFLNIFSGFFINWSDDCLSSLKKLPPKTEPETFAKAWVQSLLPHKSFLGLLPLLFIALEKNSCKDQIIKFKRLSLKVLSAHLTEMSRIFPGFSQSQVLAFFRLSQAIVSSLWAANSSSKNLEEIYSQPEFKELKPHFQKDLAFAIEIIIRGIRKTQLMTSTNTNSKKM